MKRKEFEILKGKKMRRTKTVWYEIACTQNDAAGEMLHTKIQKWKMWFKRFTYVGSVCLMKFGSILLKRTNYVDSDDEIDDHDDNNNNNNNDDDIDNDNGNTNTKWIDLTRLFFNLFAIVL